MRTRRRSPAARRRGTNPKPRRDYADVPARRAASVEPTWLHRGREGPPARSVPTATTRATGRARSGRRRGRRASGPRRSRDLPGRGERSGIATSEDDDRTVLFRQHDDVGERTGRRSGVFDDPRAVAVEQARAPTESVCQRFACGARALRASRRSFAGTTASERGAAGRADAAPEQAHGECEERKGSARNRHLNMHIFLLCTGRYAESMPRTADHDARRTQIIDSTLR